MAPHRETASATSEEDLGFSPRELAQAELRFRALVLATMRRLGPDATRERVVSLLWERFNDLVEADPAVAHFLLLGTKR